MSSPLNWGFFLTVSSSLSVARPESMSAGEADEAKKGGGNPPKLRCEPFPLYSFTHFSNNYPFCDNEVPY